MTITLLFIAVSFVFIIKMFVHVIDKDYASAVISFVLAALYFVAGLASIKMIVLQPS